MYLTIIREWLPLIILGFNVGIFVVIKFNDMKHIEESVKKIEECVKEISKENNKQGERISKIEGKCIANHG